MPFTLSVEHLHRICKINSFPVASDEMVLFALRGCLPATEESQTFGREHEIVPAQLDYIHPRCTFGQWRPAKEEFALFPGSTVPHLSYVKNVNMATGRGANQLMTGYYNDYRKGAHKAGKPTGHEAFRQVEGRPLSRTTDDYDFDTDDRVDFETPPDNLHAAWCMSVHHDKYASAGCQVVVGYPKCPQRGDLPDVGPWKAFKENAYAESQDSFGYFLLESLHAQRVALSSGAPIGARLRFGSKSALVSELQERLKAEGFYEGRIDQSFGARTLRAVLAFQSSAIATDADDGIVGHITASVLGMDLPGF